MMTLVKESTSDPAAWREAAGLHPREVAEIIRQRLGEKKRHFTSITKMEQRGSYKSNVVRAYAEAVGVPFEKALPVFENLAEKHSRKKV